MNTRKQWHSLLEAEAKRWSAKSYDQLAADLAKEQVYEVEVDGKTYQVEVELLEDTDKYLHYMIVVFDDSPWSFKPVSESFIRDKPVPSSRLHKSC